MLERTLELARQSLRRGSSPIGCVVVDAQGAIVTEGRNRSGERWGRSTRRVGDSGLAHAEMDALYRAGKLEGPEALTLYTSLEPCLMCGGAVAMLKLARVVWATDDPWGGSGRMIAWDQHPAYEGIETVAHPFDDLELEGARLFAPEAKRVYGEAGWAKWRGRYPQACQEAEAAPDSTPGLREHQARVPRARRETTEGAVSP